MLMMSFDGLGKMVLGVGNRCSDMETWKALLVSLPILAHRVLGRPLEQQLFCPRLEVAPAEVGLGLHAEVFVHVADRHVEVGAGEIAFEIVDRLEHLAGIAGDVGGAHFAAVGAGPSRIDHLAER